MAEYLTVKGQSYSVTAGSNTTVTDATGLSLSVEAGGQAQFIACADKVEVEGDCSIVQCRKNSVGSSTRSGGGGVDPSNFVSKVEFAEFQESNEQALEAKQDTLAAGDGIDIVDNTVAMSGSLDKSLAIGESHVEETIIHDGLCAVWKWDLPRSAPAFALSETGWSSPWGPEYHGSGYLESYADVEALAVEVNAVTDMAQWARAVVFQDEDGKACFCLIPTPEHSSAEILSDGMWNHPWDDNDPLVHDYGLYPYTNQRVSAVKVVSTGYHLHVNGVEMLPATDLVEAGNNAPVSSAAVYTKLGEVNAALNSKQDKLTLQTTISNNTTQVATGAAVYKALGNRTSLPTIPTTQTTLSNTTAQVPTGSAVYKALGNRTVLTFDSALSTTSTNPIQNKAVTEALSTYATKDELDDATSIVQETLHDSAWADDVTPSASGDYLSATASKDLLGAPIQYSVDLHFLLTSNPGIATGEYIHAIKVLLSGSGTGMRLFLPLSKIAVADRNISTGGAISLADMQYLSSDPLTEEDYARGYTYLYPRGFSLTVNGLLVESSLNFGAGPDESNVYFGKSPGPTIPFKTFRNFKVTQGLAAGSCLCATVNLLLKDYSGTPIGVVYKYEATLKDAVSDNIGSITAAQSKNIAQDTRLDFLETKDTEQDGRLDALKTKNTEQDGRLAALEAGGGLSTDASGDTIIDTGSGQKLLLSTHGALEGEIGRLHIAPYKQESWGSGVDEYLAVGANGAYIVMDNFYGANNEYEITLNVGTTHLSLNAEKLSKLAALISGGSSGGGETASKVWQVFFNDQDGIAWGDSANSLRDNLAAAGLNGAWLGGVWYNEWDNWTEAEPGMFPMTLRFTNPVTLAQLKATGVGMLTLMAATPMLTVD